MLNYEPYVAKASAKRANEVAKTESPFTIEVRFLGGLTENQKSAFKNAADRWTRIIVGDLPNVMVDGEMIDDVVILAQGAAIDGPGNILGQAGPTHLRPLSAGAAAFLPAKGIMSFDIDDLTQMEQDGTLQDVITHEMGHVLGIGTIWKRRGLLRDLATDNPIFTGNNAMSAYGALRNSGAATPVPIENNGGPGTIHSHWRETIFRTELMSGFIKGVNNPISSLTVASLADLGYDVDPNAAEPYDLPNLFALAEEGALLAESALDELGFVLPSIPVTLADESLEQP
jgi:hypothetical protein